MRCQLSCATLDSAGQSIGDTETSIEAVRRKFAHDLEARLRGNGTPAGIGHTTPGVSSAKRFDAAVEELVRACDGFLRRAAIRASLTADERREILRGMLLTRATDNRLKTFFTGGEVRYGDAPFQGKGFRSLGQEAIYAAGDPAAARRGVPAGRRVARRRRRAADPRSRRRRWR